MTDHKGKDGLEPSNISAAEKLDALLQFRSVHGSLAPLPQDLAEMFAPEEIEPFEASVRRLLLLESKSNSDDEGMFRKAATAETVGRVLAFCVLVGAIGWLATCQMSASREERLIAAEQAQSAREAADRRAELEAQVEEATAAYLATKRGENRGARGFSDAQIDRLTTYAVYLGRGVACDVPTGRARYNQVSAWIRSTAASDAERDAMGVVLMTGMSENQQRQVAGSSPDSCDTVRRQFERIDWP